MDNTTVAHTFASRDGATRTHHDGLRQWADHDAVDVAEP
jgi:hypothetical protein